MIKELEEENNWLWENIRLLEEDQLVVLMIMIGEYLALMNEL